MKKELRLLGLHENIIVASVLTFVLVVLRFLKIIDYDVVWIFSPLWILVLGVVAVYIVTSLLRIKPSVDEDRNYFNYCKFPSHPGIISERKAKKCGIKCCKYYKIYKEEV